MRSQVLRPPYVYRWAVLIASTVLLAALAIRALQPDPEVADRAHVAPSAAPEKKPPPVAADVVRQLRTTEKVVALTFDDGPHRDYTREVLEVLADHHAVATFCMVGKQVAAHPELVREVVDAGMRLCNHTVGHDEQLSGRTEAAVERELVDANDLLHDAAGDSAEIRYFRAPGGNWTRVVERTAARHGMRPLGWSLDPRDWARPGVAKIVAAVRENVRPGSVILLHDGGGRRDQTVAALRILLPWLAGQGYRFDFPA